MLNKLYKIFFLLIISILCYIPYSYASQKIQVKAYAYYAYISTGKTAMGTRCIPRKTIAVDPRIIPLGSKVVVPGIGICIASDTGGAIRGKKIDIAMGSVAECKRFGVRNLMITVL